MPVYPEGFGSGSGLARAHGPFLDSLNQMMGGGYGPSGQRLMRGMKVLQEFSVDLAAGDDGLDNDGSKPFKSLQVALDRFPLYASNLDFLYEVTPGFVQGYPGPVVIRLGPGVHVINRGLQRVFPFLIVMGSVRVVDKFKIASRDTEGITLTKDGSTPDWTASQHRKRFVRLPIPAYNDYWGQPYLERQPIIDNTEDTITIAWTPPPLGYAPNHNLAVGTEIEIIELESEIRFEDYAQIAIDGGTFQVEQCVIDNQGYTCIYSNVPRGGGWYYACHFKNGYYTTEGFFFYGCIFEDVYYPHYLWGLKELYLQNCFYLNCSGAVLAQQPCLVVCNSHLFFENCSDGFMIGSGMLYLGSRRIYARNVANAFVLNAMARAIDEMGLENYGDKPACVWNVGGGSFLQLRTSSAAEAVDADDTLQVGGVGMSLSTFRTTHSSHYTDAKENRVTEEVAL